MSDGILLREALLWLVVLLLVYKLVDWLIRLPVLANDKERYILITGCDSGFGEAVSRRLAGRGCYTFAACLTEKGEENLHKAGNRNLMPFHMDVSCEESVSEALDFVMSKLPANKGLWALVNNAAIQGLMGPMEWLTKTHYQNVLDVNLHGVISTCRMFLPLVKQEHGRIVNISSMLGRTTFVGPGPYAIAKHGVESFSDSLRREMRPFRVSVHIVEPGLFRTPMSEPSHVESMLRAAWTQTQPSTKQQYGQEYLDALISASYSAQRAGLLSARVDLVHAAYEHAMLARWPRARYVVGIDARFVMLPIQLLPEWLADWLHQLMAPTPTPAACR